MPKPKRKPRRNRKSDAKAKAKAAAKAAAATIAKRPAAAKIAKRPAAATPLGKFQLKAWIAHNVTRDEAAAVPIRRYFVSKLHHRVRSDAVKSGVSDARVRTMRGQVRDKVGTVHDSVHK